MTPMLRSGETSHIVSPPRQSLPWRIAKLHRINAHEHGAESREVEANQPNARDGEVRPGQCRAHTRSAHTAPGEPQTEASAALHCSARPPAAARAQAHSHARKASLRCRYRTSSVLRTQGRAPRTRRWSSAWSTRVGPTGAAGRRGTGTGRWLQT
jgi:hypothetical protein